MKRLTSVLSFFVLAFLLTACLGDLIGEQEATNALGLDGESVEVTKVEPEVASFAPQQVADETYRGLVDLDEFEDVSLPGGLPAPQSYTESIGLTNSVTMDAPAPADAADLPESFTITSIAFDLNVDDDTSAPASVDFEANELDLTFTKGNCGNAAVASCTYTTSDSPAGLIALAITGGDFDQVWKVISSGGPNTLAGTVDVTIAPSSATPADNSITFTLDTQSGTVNFAN